MSGKLENLRRLLSEGYTPSELVAQGHPKSSVYKAAHQLRRRGSRPSYARVQAEDVPVEYSPYPTEVELSSAIGARAINEPTVRRKDIVSRIDQQYERLRIERIEREAREAAIAEEQARREQEKISRSRRLFNEALAAHKAGKINNYQLIALTSGRETIDDIESGENLLRGLLASASIRLQREASQAAIAEEQAKREQVQKVENARARLFKNAIAAHKAGNIDFHQLLVLTRGRHTLEDIERGENALKLSTGKPLTH